MRLGMQMRALGVFSGLLQALLGHFRILETAWLATRVHLCDRLVSRSVFNPSINTCQVCSSSLADAADRLCRIWRGDCGQACVALNLPLPTSVSMQLGEAKAVFQELVSAAQRPTGAIPETASLKVSCLPPVNRIPGSRGDGRRKQCCQSVGLRWLLLR